jgi:hypothetical protein
VSQEAVDNSAGSNGDLRITVRRGAFWLANGDSITIAHRFDPAYVLDNQTAVKDSSSGTRARLGMILDVDSALGVLVLVGASQLAEVSAVEAMANAHDVHLLSAQVRIPVSVMALREATAFDVGAITANGGVLASDTTPVLSAINDATDGCQRVLWAASNNDQVIFQIPLPADLDDTADLKLYTRIASGGTTNAVGFTVKSFFDEADTAVDDTSATNQTTAYVNALTTIAAADVPADAKTLTIGLTPVAHTTDTLAMTAVWLEYTRKLLTS